MLSYCRGGRAETEWALILIVLNGSHQLRFQYRESFKSYHSSFVSFLDVFSLHILTYTPILKCAPYNRTYASSWTGQVGLKIMLNVMLASLAAGGSEGRLLAANKKPAQATAASGTQKGKLCSGYNRNLPSVLELVSPTTYYPLATARLAARSLAAVSSPNPCLSLPADPTSDGWSLSMAPNDDLS